MTPAVLENIERILEVLVQLAGAIAALIAAIRTTKTHNAMARHFSRREKQVPPND